MNQFSQEQIEVLISNAQKPKPISNSGYPLNDLDDRVFEILTYSIFKERVQFEKQLKKRFDDVILMQGVGEKGMDCILLKKNKIASVIQCKKYKSNVSDKMILAELIKFCLHVIASPSSFDLDRKFTYYLATSSGFTGRANLLPNSIKSGSFITEYNIEEITKAVAKKYKEFKGIKFNEVQRELIRTLQSLSYEFIRPEDYNIWINDYPSLIETFFEVKKYTDNKLIESKSKEIVDVIKELFNGKESEDVKNLINTYKTVAKEKLNVVNFIGFDIQKHRQRPDNITLTDLFVQPSFQQRVDEKKIEKFFSIGSRELKITNLFKSEKNIIILGEPGAGKSLLVKFLIVNIITHQAEKLGIKHLANHLPIRIELRKYNEVRDSKSLTNYISDVLNKDFQCNLSVTQLEKLLENSTSLVFFDGLDEIFNISSKTKVKEDIETFSLRYPNAKCVVTSRFIGYHDIKFNPNRFDEFAISRFNKIQIKELVSKFYETQQANLERRNKSIDSCMGQLQNDVDDELKSNPLILTLILILTSNNIIIPESKLEIYESCTKTLVDSIDIKEKELRFELPVKNKNLTFSHLAYWQYKSMSKGLEISNPKAVKTIADFLLQRKEASEFSEAENKAEKFLEYAERRSIYFENNFTHKTFLEYFTAEYLYSTCIAKASDEGRKELMSVASKYLSSAFWYIVFDLLFTRIDRVQPDNELLDEIFGKQIDGHSLDVFYFLVSNLAKFNNVSSEIKSKIIERTLILCIKGEKMKNNLRRDIHFEENSLLYKVQLLRTNKETSNLLQEVIFKIESDGLSEKQEIEFYNLYYEIISFDYRFTNLDKLEIKNSKRLKQLANLDQLLFSHVYLKRSIRPEKIEIDILIKQIENFGSKSLFNYMPLRHLEGTRRIDSFDLYLLNILETSDFDSFKSDLKRLMDHGLKFEMIIKHVDDTNLLYFIRSENLEKILKLYLKSDDKTVDEILERILRKDPNMKSAYAKYRSENQHPKLKKIDKLYGKK